MSDPGPLERIAGRLQTSPAELAFLARFDLVRLEELDAAIAATQDQEDVEVERSMRDAVRLVPPPLRKRAWTVLFPDVPPEVGVGDE